MFSETVAYMLANLVGLSVPEFALCMYGGDDRVHFASRYKTFRFRVEDAVPRSANPDLVAEVVPFDIWVHNEDRNISNFVYDIDSGASGLNRLYAIDFEKSRALGGMSVIELAGLDAEKSWPKDDLRKVSVARPVPPEACERIKALGPDAIEGALSSALLNAPVPDGFNLTLVVKYLGDRAAHLGRLVKEAWNG